MQENPAKRVMQRCPACGARVALDVAACDMCGHEFGTTMPNKAVAYAPPGRRARNPEPAADPATESLDGLAEPQLAAPMTASTRISMLMRRLPWGVIGTLAVVGSIIGALALAVSNRSIADRFLPAQPTPRITVQFLFTPVPVLPPTVVPILLPTSPPTAVATATPVPPRFHVVQAGDVCGTIAEQYEIGLSVLIAANNLGADCPLGIGDRLRIPFPGSTVAGSAAANANTPTPAPLQLATQTPRIGFAEPVAMGPADGSMITNTDDALTLQWLTVGLLGDSEWYVVTVQPDGQPLVPLYETKATSLKLSAALLGEFQQRKVTWWVQVKRLIATSPNGSRNYEDRSTPSTPRTFTWQRATAPSATRQP